MNITLVHPVHGAKVAIHHQEIEADEKNGWVRYHPETPPDQPTEASPVDHAPVKRNKLTRKTNQPSGEIPDFLTSAGDAPQGG